MDFSVFYISLSWIWHCKHTLSKYWSMLFSVTGDNKAREHHVCTTVQHRTAKLTADLWHYFSVHGPTTTTCLKQALQSMHYHSSSNNNNVCTILPAAYIWVLRPVEHSDLLFKNCLTEFGSGLVTITKPSSSSSGSAWLWWDQIQFFLARALSLHLTTQTCSH